MGVGIGGIAAPQTEKQYAWVGSSSTSPRTITLPSSPKAGNSLYVETIFQYGASITIELVAMVGATPHVLWTAASTVGQYRVLTAYIGDANQTTTSNGSISATATDAFNASEVTEIKVTLSGAGTVYALAVTELNGV
jgi:hypothetical protein